MTPEQFRAAHAANPEKCSETCPGWAIFDAGTDRVAICICDECWYFYDRSVTDDDAAELPEAQLEFRLTTSLEALDYLPNWRTDLYLAARRLMAKKPLLAAQLMQQERAMGRWERRLRVFDRHGDML